MPAIAAFGKVSSKLHGVEFGVAGYSYNSLPRQGLIDAVIQSMVDCGIGQCLLYGPSTEPVELADKARPARGGFGGARGGSGGRGAGGGRGGSGAGRGGGRGPASPEQAAALEQLHQWHLTVKLDYYTAIRKKFADAGLVITGYDATSDIGTNNADEDLNRACEVTQALGAKCMMCAITKPVAKRLAPIADKHALKVGLQGRPNMNSTNGDAMATPSDFGDVMAYSKNFGSSIDVGDATGGGWDVVKFVEDTHPRVFGLNLKDRTKANMSMPWGEGDTHIDKILQFVRDKKYPVRCYIDCDYQTPEGGTRQADVKRCFEYAKKALA
jgi:sugar phosphate isomerase/epimerase